MKHPYVCNWTRWINLPDLENHLYNLHQPFSRTIKKAHQVKNAILFTFVLLGFGQVCWGQVSGDYRSNVVAGNWGASASWQLYNGTTWITSTNAPTLSNNVTILNGHTITLAAAGNVKNLTVNSGGIVNLSTFTLTFAASGTYNGIPLVTNQYMSSPTVANWSIDANWSVVANWWKCSIANTIITATSAPYTSNDVIILSGHTIIQNALNGYTRDLTINGTLTCNSNNTLNVYGNFINNGILNYSSGGIVNMKGSIAQMITCNSIQTNFYKLIIANTNYPVTANKSFNIISTMNINSRCYFKPDAEVIISGKDNSSLTGTGTVQVTRSDNYVTDPGGNYMAQYPNFSAGRTVVIVEYAGASAQVISNISTYTTLKINNIFGGTLYSQATCEDLNIDNGVFYIAPGSTLTVSNTTTLGSAKCLVLQSNAIPLTGSFIHSGSFSGVGTVKVERYMSHSNNWHIYSSPVGYVSNTIKNPVTIHEFLLNNPEIPDLVNEIDGTPLGVGMREYNTATNEWSPYFIYKNGDTSTPPNNMDIGKGFSIRTSLDLHNPVDHSIISGTGTIDAIGIPNSNIVDVALSRSADPLDVNDKGWNCIGNPFTNAIDIPSFILANSGSLDDAFIGVYVWDTNNITSSKTTPEYIVINNSGGSQNNISSVQIGQGFFVKSIPSGGIVNFNSEMWSSSPNLSFKSAKPIWPSINIVAQSQTLSSSTQIKFITNTTKGLDRGFDAGMLKANQNFSLYSKLLVDNAVDFTIQCLPDQNYDQYVIPIGIDCKVAGDITFTAETVNLPSGCQALLEDRLTRRFTRLDLKDAKYTATVSADTKGTGRFYLHTSDVISGDIPLENQPFKVYETGKTVYINGEVSKNAKFFVYSANGKQLANFLAESQVQNQFSVTGFPAGVYILTVDDKNQKKSVKFLIEN